MNNLIDKLIPRVSVVDAIPFVGIWTSIYRSIDRISLRDSYNRGDIIKNTDLENIKDIAYCLGVASFQYIAFLYIYSLSTN